MNSLAGRKYGNWLVLNYVGNRKYLCECQCDKRTLKEVHEYSLKSGKSTSCGKCNSREINTGDKFGEWEAIGDVENYKVLCRCSCGKEKQINVYTLLSGKSSSCGHNKNKDKVSDITGKKFGELTVKEYLGNSTWKCECSCGKLRNVKLSKLLNGTVSSCGHDKEDKFINLRGQEFGKLKALEYIGNKKWICECECGNKKIIRTTNLINGSTKSCGCIHNHFTKESIIKKIENFEKIKNRKPFTNELAELLCVNIKITQYNIEKYNLRNYLNNSYSSSYEREIAGLFTNATLGDRETLKPYELDIYVPEKKLAIEFNGTYWHSSLNKNYKYHQNKTIECAKRGIRLIHIFEYEWLDTDKKEKILNIILDKDKRKVYARKTHISLIEKETAYNFLEKYHLQGGTSSEINIGCFDSLNKELLGVISLGKPRFNHSYQYEIHRLCWKPDVIVIGGTERMFKYFLNIAKPTSIITYCDISKFTGNVYLKLGFNPIHPEPITEPNYVWVSDDNKEVLTRYKTQKQLLIKNGLGKEEQTEDEIMYNLGYYKVYDSGNLRLEWKEKQ